MRIYYITLLLCLYSSVLKTQITYSILRFGDTLSNNRGSVSLVDEDLHVFFAGTISNGILESDDVTLFKIDANGNIIWNYNYGNEHSEFVNNMIFTQDEFIVICGDVRDPETSDLNGFIMKMDTTGSLIFYETYGSDSTNEDFYGITTLEDGNFAVTGFITSTSGTGNDILMVRYSSDGDLVNDLIFGSTGNDVGMGITEAENGDIIISGDRVTGGLFYNAFITRINSANEIIWDQFVSLPVNSGCKTLQKTFSGNFILCGESASDISPLFDILLATFDEDGNIILLNTIPGIGVEAAYDICEAQSGEFFLTGFGYNPATDNNDIIVVYVDSTLTEIDRKYFGEAGADLAYDIKTDGYGNFWASGFTTEGDNVRFTLIYDKFELGSEIIQNNYRDNFINIYPNPTINYFAIESGLSIDRLEIFDMNGRMLLFENNLPINTEINLPSVFTGGLLVFKIYSGDQVHIKKIIAG